jgi:4-carboxymuconolactone decarboxylase
VTVRLDDGLDGVARRKYRGSPTAEAKGHVAANLSVGSGRGVLLAVITQLLPFIGYPRSLNALRVLNEMTSR